jgi:hypothetical protein
MTIVTTVILCEKKEVKKNDFQSGFSQRKVKKVDFSLPKP